MLISCLFVFLEVCNVTPTYRKSWAKNLLIWSDFTLGFSFKVKQCLNGFGEFSFWWIQFASVVRCDRSSYILVVGDLNTTWIVLFIHLVKCVYYLCCQLFICCFNIFVFIKLCKLFMEICKKLCPCTYRLPGIKTNTCVHQICLRFCFYYMLFVSTGLYIFIVLH